MRSWVKLLVIALLVAFAASTAVQSAQTTAMAIEMAIVVDGDDGGCSKCPSGSDGGGVSCAAGCVVPSIASNAVSLVIFVPGLGQALNPANSDSLVTWQPPPEPHPPRTIVLS